MIAAMFFGAAVFVLTVTLWPRSPKPTDPVFIEDESTPRTLH